MKSSLKKAAAVLLLLALSLSAVLPFAAAAGEDAPKVVRVGWFDSSFCYWDQFGRRCGVDYEYQQKISAYTGWTFEYVEDSWPNLFEKLEKGEIDLLADVSYKPEREEFLSYPDLPMGSETYYIYIHAGNDELRPDDLSSFNGKRIGVNKGSVQAGFLQDWADKNGLTIEIVPLTTEQNESNNMLIRGALDGLADIYSVNADEKIFPACRIGSSDYYYAVTKSRPDILAELNRALASIHEEDPYFNERLSETRISDSRTTASISPEESAWLEAHNPVRVGYVENFMPFCQTDPETGRLTGALKDFLAHAENSLGISRISFDTKPYASTAAALDALKAGEVDCIFPVYLNNYDAEQKGVRLSNPAMKTGMNEVMHETDSETLSRDSNVPVAIVSGDINAQTFIMDQYPSCRILTFPDDKSCYEAVANGSADSTLISNYRVFAAEEDLSRYNLYSVPSGEHIPLSFAVNRADRDLYFVLSKAVLTVQSGEMDSALASYMRSTGKVTFAQFLKDHWLLVLGVVALVLLLVIFILLQRLSAQRKAHEQKRVLEEAAAIAELKQTITSLLDNMPGRSFTKDAKSGVYLACSQTFAEYAHKKSPEEVLGHTAEELFDPVLAKHLIEDDRMALSMDEPYIFFEELPDAAGNKRQIKTTKQKYTDANGRLCILGVSQDVTDSFRVRIRRDDAATKESYEKAKGSGIIYAHIAQALARGYSDLYYVDLNTEGFIEYRTDPKTGELTEIRRGWHFFEECQDDIAQFVCADDQEALQKALDRKTLLSALDQNNTFMTTYRLVGENGPTYVNMKVTRMTDDDRYIVLGVTNIDEQARRSAALMRAEQEQIAYNRLSALAGDYICAYVVDPETGRFREFNATAVYLTLAQKKEGDDFFAGTREAIRRCIHPEDLNRFLTVFTKENVLAEIKQNGIFTVSYRLILDGRPRYVQLKGAMVEEKAGYRLIFGINDIDKQVRQEEKYVDNLSRAKIEATVDGLTGVKNRHAWLMAEERLNSQIAEDPSREFAVVLLDVNDLKKVNDTEGHAAGDDYLRAACRIVCKTFAHSPVFRVGGDEFAVIAQGDDYTAIDELVARLNEQNEEALRSGGIVIACGMAKREGDSIVASVFERADQKMYDNKANLKNRCKG